MADVVDYVLKMIGLGSPLGKTEPMSPQAQLRYKEATGYAINEPTEEEIAAAAKAKEANIVPTDGQVNLENNRRREELKKEELVTLLARQKSIADKAKRGEYK
jgi:hypothetical protein